MGSSYLTAMALLTLAALYLPGSARADEIIVKRTTVTGQAHFDQEHHTEFIWDALERLGQRPAAGASRAELARAVLAELSQLPDYGMKSTSAVEGTIPRWVYEGQSRFAPATLSKSRYISGAAAGTYPEFGDLAALYTYYSIYDSEWFAASRKPGYRAWLSAACLHYCPQWASLSRESVGGLHDRLVTPLQTPDEPLKEIDNWINALKRPTIENEPVVFAKPKVRSVLVAELLHKAGLEADARLFEVQGYSSPQERAGLSEADFYTLAALSLELFQELCEADPGNPQVLYFRDYFVAEFWRNS
jgi:hypothetical protein